VVVVVTYFETLRFAIIFSLILFALIILENEDADKKP
jgi:hypothetical protein